MCLSLSLFLGDLYQIKSNLNINRFASSLITFWICFSFKLLLCIEIYIYNEVVVVAILLGSCIVWGLINHCFAAQFLVECVWHSVSLMFFVQS